MAACSSDRVSCAHHGRERGHDPGLRHGQRRDDRDRPSVRADRNARPDRDGDRAAVRLPHSRPRSRSGALNPLDTPHTYIADSCQYLKAKWDPNNAAPGTIVMVIMFHSIEKGAETSSNPMHVGSGDFKRLMKSLHDMGFQAINTKQLADFLDTNAKIPPRSVVLIQDDRHAAENFNDWFRPYWKEWGWPVVNAWISFDDSIRTRILQENIALGAEGLVDYQSHGTVHNINMTDTSSDEYIRSEFEGSIKDFQQNFNKTPIGIIWPGGGFGLRPVQIAREFGYRVGFTTHPRGPIMFNWIPLADANDAGRPAYVAEGYVNDPRDGTASLLALASARKPGHCPHHGQRGRRLRRTKQGCGVGIL